jgi:hypothetical protein
MKAPIEQEVIGTGASIIKQVGLVSFLVMTIVAGALLIFNMHVNSTECARQDLNRCQADLVVISKESAQANYEMSKAILELKLTLDRLSRAIESKYPVAVQ